MHMQFKAAIPESFWQLPRRGRLVFGAALIVVFLSGCGASTRELPGGTGDDAGTGESTPVTVFVSAKANDQLASFFLALESLTLTTDSGQTVSLLEGPQYLELMHVNGKPEPVATVTIPEGVYTSATATVGGSDFWFYGIDPATGNLESSQDLFQQVPESGATVSMQPIAINGSTSGLTLEMQVSQSACWVACNTGSPTWYSITPSFVLSAASSTPTGASVRGLRGLVSQIDSDGTGFSITSANILLWEMNPPGPSWHISRDGSEVYQGIGGPSQLTVGMAVDVDGSTETNGSVLASRISAYDANTADLSVSTGPLLRIWASTPYLFFSHNYVQGLLPGTLGAAPFSFGSSVFQVSPELTNLQELPFSASFTAANAVAGQNVSISSHALAASPPPIYIPATTITLLPQTINGTVSAIGVDGGFTTYTVTLAPYDLFPQLAVQDGQTTLLTNPNTVVVYADSNTQMLSTNPIAVGGVARFYGLVFNDNGALRMDCAQVSDGVPE